MKISTLIMKILAFLLLKICEVFVLITNGDPIVFNDLKIPLIIDFERVKFGKGFYMQERFVFNGTINEKADQFKIALAEGDVNESNIQLDFTVNFQAKLVFRNNWIKNKGWGCEDTSGGFPFKARDSFILDFIAMPRDEIKISVNNKFFTLFRRKDLGKISHLYVTGENTVQINSLTLYHNNLKPTIPTTEATTMPYQHCPKPIVLINVTSPSYVNFEKNGFGKGFKANKRIIFKGIPLQGSNEFTINFVENGVMYQTANVPLIFKSNLQSDNLHITTWTVFGGWDGSSVYRNPFKVGEPFILEFIATPKDSIDVIFVISARKGCGKIWVPRYK